MATSKNELYLTEINHFNCLVIIIIELWKSPGLDIT